MQNKLNPNFETLFLICNAPWDEKKKEEVIIELEKCGFWGQDFYNRFFQPIETYYQTFSEHMVSCPGTDFLQEIDEAALSVCIGAFVDHPDWFTDLSRIPDDIVRDCVQQMILSESEHNYEDVFDVLADLPELSEKAKWQQFMLSRKAKETLLVIAEAVNLNLTAYEKAVASVDAVVLQQLLDQLQESIDAADKASILRWREQLNPDAVIVPTLALPTVILIINDACFCGLLFKQVSPGEAIQITKEELIIGAKVLSDRSKVEILLCLREKSCYSLEIAEQVGLTPATVSHHMNMLLGAGFVEFEKRDGKVYYKLAGDAVKRYFAGSSQLLLPLAEDVTTSVSS